MNWGDDTAGESFLFGFVFGLTCGLTIGIVAWAAL